MRRSIFRIAICVATAAGAFALPYAFPPNYPAVSVSYLAGFNNRIAAICVAFLSLISIAYFSLQPGPERVREGSSSQAPLSKKFLVIACLGAFFVSSMLGWLIIKNGIAYWDPSYFIDRMRSSITFGLRPYVDLEFPYGPFLFYFPILVYHVLRTIGWSIEATYYGSYAILATAGVGILFYVINEMPLSLRWKKISFVLLATQSVTPTIGINYTFCRFVAPFALFLLVSRCQRFAALLFGMCIAVFTAFCISPEMGIALSAGLSAYSLIRFRTELLHFAILLLGPLAGYMAFLMLFGRAALATLTQFGHGIFNFVLQPLPYLLIFLVAVVWLVPQIVARSLWGIDRDDRILGIYVIALALLPAALGRADPMHVMSNGFAFFLLSFVAITLHPNWSQKLWVCAVASVCIFTQIVDAADYKSTLRAILPGHRRMLAGLNEPPKWLHVPSQSIDITAIRTIVGNNKISTPVTVASVIEDQLRAANLTRPSYYYYLVGVWDEATEVRKVDEMRQFNFAILPDDPIEYWESPAWQSEALGGGYQSRIRRPIYMVGHLISRELKDHWIPRAHFGQYVLYQRVG